jgi:hypothetical protein
MGGAPRIPGVFVCRLLRLFRHHCRPAITYFERLRIRRHRVLRHARSLPFACRGFRSPPGGSTDTSTGYCARTNRWKRSVRTSFQIRSARVFATHSLSTVSRIESVHCRATSRVRTDAGETEIRARRYLRLASCHSFSRSSRFISLIFLPESSMAHSMISNRRVNLSLAFRNAVSGSIPS